MAEGAPGHGGAPGAEALPTVRIADDTLVLDGRRFAVRRLTPDTPAPERPAADTPAPDTTTSGPTLVFLHEGLGSIGQWKDFPQALCAAMGLRGFVYDRLGYGASDGFEGPRGTDYLHREAEVWLPRIAAAEGWGDAIVPVGHSDGGSIALLYAARHRVRALVTMAAHVFVEEVTLAGIREARTAWHTTDLKDRLARYHGAKTEAMFLAWNDTWQTKAFRTWNIETALPEIRDPLLAIQGVQDEYGTAAQIEAILTGAGGPAEGILIPDCRHIPHLQAREAVIGAITRFVGDALRHAGPA